MGDLKIPLQNADRIPTRCWPDAQRGNGPTTISKALPVYYSLRGAMAHRVRSGHIYPPKLGSWPRPARAVFRPWCHQLGTVGNGWGHLAAVPPDGRPVCGTCEGRAVGAGYPGIAILQQRYELLYSPREGRATPPAKQAISA